MYFGERANCALAGGNIIQRKKINVLKFSASWETHGKFLKTLSVCLFFSST